MQGQRRVLYIGSPFFNYYKHIREEFESQGYIVDYYNDRPLENSFLKGILKLNRNILDRYIYQYINRILMETRSNHYDLVFIMNSKAFTDDMILLLKNCHNTAKFVLYMWDSINLYPHVKGILRHFDRRFSFDFDDCMTYEGMEYLPLFYYDAFEKLGPISIDNSDFDIISVCTAHPNRYTMIKQLFPMLQAKGIRIYSYMYLHKLQYYYNKISVKEFKNARSNEFKFTPLSEQDYIEMLRKSNVVFDINHNKQSGLTMRTIETIGARRKLITTNKNIMQCDLFSENNILILNDSNWEEIPEFIKRDYEPIDAEIYTKYSLRSWLRKITECVRYEG